MTRWVVTGYAGYREGPLHDQVGGLESFQITSNIQRGWSVSRLPW
jgi:hypothetical protein